MMGKVVMMLIAEGICRLVMKMMVEVLVLVVFNV